MKICLKNYYIKNFMGSLTNTKAPEFKLADTSGKLISLNHFNIVKSVKLLRGIRIVNI